MADGVKQPAGKDKSGEAGEILDPLSGTCRLNQVDQAPARRPPWEGSRLLSGWHPCHRLHGEKLRTVLRLRRWHGRLASTGSAPDQGLVPRTVPSLHLRAVLYRQDPIHDNATCFRARFSGFPSGPGRAPDEPAARCGQLHSGLIWGCLLGAEPMKLSRSPSDSGVRSTRSKDRRFPMSCGPWSSA